MDNLTTVVDIEEGFNCFATNDCANETADF